jgi:hypothetical protein
MSRAREPHRRHSLAQGSNSMFQLVDELLLGFDGAL